MASKKCAREGAAGGGCGGGVLGEDSGDSEGVEAGGGGEFGFRRWCDCGFGGCGWEVIVEDISGHIPLLKPHLSLHGTRLPLEQLQDPHRDFRIRLPRKSPPNCLSERHPTRYSDIGVLFELYE